MCAALFFMAPGRGFADSSDVRAVTSPLDQLMAAQDRPTLTIAVPPASPPYVMTDPQGGIVVDTLRALARQAGFEPRLRHAPLRRLPALLASGKADAVLSYQANGARPTVTRPVTFWHNGIVMLSERGGSDGPVDLSGMTVGHFPDFRAFLGLDADFLSEAAHLVSLDRSEQALDMLLRGRIDAYVGDYWVLRYLRARAATPPHGAALPELRVIHMFEPTPHTLRVHSPALRARLDAALAQMEKSRRMAAIVERYMPGTVSR
ncbi:substrate-binding periplasmic protein [Yunchengibacter salinarum]|uniref:substrate-binding periplasmic protein n=1 Tax=Yunchengibacter salinarum TaxID=3133399 RepID=UPI0035B67DDB